MKTTENYIVGDMIRIISGKRKNEMHTIRDIETGFYNRKPGDMLCRETSYVLDDNSKHWFDEDFEMVCPNIKIGDTLMLNPDAKLKVFAYNMSSVDETNGSIFLARYAGDENVLKRQQYMYFDKPYTVDNIFEDKNSLDLGVHFKEFEGDEYIFNSLLFKRVKTKRVTMAEVEEKFGCKVEIIDKDK